MVKNKIRLLREKLAYTQSDLAEHSNLSKRTIQRVEAGQTIPKGHTLKALASALGVDKSELQAQEALEESVNTEEELRLKMINLSSFLFIGIPFGNIFIPYWIWNKYRKHSLVDSVGRKIINFQITWTILTCLFLIISPFLQDYIPEDYTLILLVGLLAACVNIFFILKTTFSLQRREYDILPLSLQFL